MSDIVNLIENKLKNGENAMIMAVGDSITFGTYYCDDEDTYCACLARGFAGIFPDTEVLRYDGRNKAGNMPIDGYNPPVKVGKGKKGRITVVRCGVGGDTVRRAINRFDDYSGEFLTGERPDVFLLMFGINDSLEFDASKFVTPQKFYDDLKELRCLLDKTNPEALFVHLTPTYGDDGTSNISSLDGYSDMVKRLAEETNAKLIDTHKLWMEHLEIGGENYGQGDWLAEDKWHFSAKGSRKTGEFIFNELCK